MAPHVLVIPYPAQGHVMPLMELSRQLVDHGLKITFVNTEFNHNRIVASASTSGEENDDMIRLVSIPDGLEPEDDRNDLVKLNMMMLKVMPAHTRDLIGKINQSDSGDDKITCILADWILGWAFEVAEELGILKAAFWPSCAILLAVTLHIPRFIEDGVIDASGNLINKEMIQLSPTMPSMNPANFTWLRMGGGPILQKSLFHCFFSNTKYMKLAHYLLCNSFYQLEPSAFKIVPNLRPIGPLYTSSRLATFWPENSTCLSWLDQQQAGSVIYIAFGSLTLLEKRQFDELALGLELCGKPFLWVVRPDLTDGPGNVYPHGFEERVSSRRGQIVSWAPQREVLAHPSVGCFMSHCGWNSTMEGLSQGVPFLCWPYFADQFYDQICICDIWKVGLELNKDSTSGLISKEEIASKVVRLLGDVKIKENSAKWKQIAVSNVSKGGSSFNNFEDFAHEIKR